MFAEKFSCKECGFFYDYQIYIDISDIHIYQIPFVVKNVENALRDRTVIYFNIQKKSLNKTRLRPFDNKCIFMRMTSTLWRTLMMFVILV